MDKVTMKPHQSQPTAQAPKHLCRKRKHHYENAGLSQYSTGNGCQATEPQTLL